MKSPYLTYLASLSLSLLLLFTIATSLFNIELKDKFHFIYDYGMPSYNATNLRITMPQQVIDDLILEKALLDNTAPIPNQNTFPHFFYDATALIPNSSVSAYFLFSKHRISTDPPVLYIKSTKELSPTVQNYIKEESYYKYIMTADSQGYRTSLPTTHSKIKALLIGDSVAMGQGVNDAETIASQIQSLSNKKLHLYNAGISGNPTENNFHRLKEELKKRSYDFLIYIICQNDLSSYDNTVELHQIVNRLKRHSNHFKKVIILHHADLEITAADLFNNSKSPIITKQMHEVEYSTLKLTEKTNLKYINWFNQVQKEARSLQSPLYPVSLYIDNCHFSNRGNKYAAQLILNSLQNY